MSVQNHTYNINYPNMNFGQTILQGMFGSLTGCMGMNGSIFSSLGMGGCCGGFGGFGMTGFGGYTDQMIGMQIGSSIFNYGMMALGQYLEGRRDKETTNDPATSIETLNTKIAELEAQNTDDEVAKVIDKSYQTNIDNAKSRSEALPGEIVAKQKLIDDAKAAENPDNANIAKLEEQLTKLKQEQQKVDGAVTVEGSILYYEKAKQDAIAAQQKVNQVEIDKIKAERDAAQKELDKQEQIALLNKYDSTALKRAKKSSLEKYASDEPSKDVATRAEIYSALNAYKKAEKNDDNANMNKYKRILTQIAKNGGNDLKDFKPAFQSLGISIKE